MKHRRKFEKESVKEDIDYTSLIFRQIDRINIAVNQSDAQCIRSVDVLENLLTPHHDPKYLEKDLKYIKDWYKDQLVKAKIMGRVPPEAQIMIDFNKAMKKFRALMRLINRKGLLPEKRGESIAYG